MHKLLFFYCFLLVYFPFTSQSIYAQTDTVFWFGAPEVIADHGDRPIRIFCSSTLDNVDVVLSQPANPNFQPISVSILAGSSYSFDLTKWISSIETPHNQVLNNGLLLESTGLITAYYEIMPRLNPDIFSLKGNNALGTEFWIPGQNHYFNGPYRGNPRSGYVIVATEDNTLVTIKPKNELVGHPAGVAFNIRLNKGQCYAVRAIGSQKDQHVGGDYIISDKKIAVTLKDDSLGLGIGCWDLGGDQLIPTNIIGTDYIIRRGALLPEDRYFITATMNNTNIYINGSTTSMAMLNAGEIGNFVLKDPSVLISANHPIYVLHVTGFGCELGFGIVPPYPCTGSRTVYFTRSNSDPMGLFVFTRTKNISSFLINDNSSTLSQQSFNIVPGTNGDYSSAYIDLSNIINVGLTTNITNTKGVFHVGIINGRSGTSSRYGYFSNFGRAKSQYSELSVCKGDSVTLHSNSSYTHEWYRNEVFIHSDSILSIAIDSALEIKLITEKQFGCIDTLYYNFKLNKNYKIKQYQQICQGEFINFGNQIISQKGIYTDSLKTELNCDSIIYLDLIVNPTSSDTIIEYSCFELDTGWSVFKTKNINGCDSIISTYTNLMIGTVDTIFHSICEGDSVNINGDWFTKQDTLFYPNTTIFGCDSNELFYIHLNPSNHSYDSINVCPNEKYKGKFYQRDTIIIDTFTNVDGCDSLDTHSLNILSSPKIIIIGDSILCNNNQTIIKAQGGMSYAWNNGKKSDSIVINHAGQYWVEGIDQFGCIAKDTILINTPKQTLNILSAPPICPNIDDGKIKISNFNSNYEYFINGKPFDSLELNLGPGNYIIKLIDEYGCTLEEQIYFNEPVDLNLNMPDSLIGYVGNTIEINPNINLKLNSSKWKPPTHLTCDTCFKTEAVIQKTSWLYYLYVTDYRGCTTIDSIYIKGILRNIYVPNVFSPNNDHINDKFTLFSNDGYEIIEELKIYSRWGELLYVGIDLPFNDPNYGWNGIFNNEPMNPGVYAYTAKVLRTDGITELLYGDVTLVK